MAAKVICFASAKGGAGKTMIAASVAELLTQVGKSVLLIDADASTNGLSLLYLKEVRQGSELAMADGVPATGMFEDSEHKHAFLTSLRKGAYLVPAAYEFRNTAEMSAVDFSTRLEMLIHNARSDFDAVIIDAQAGSDPYASLAMRRGLSDEVIIVSEYDPMSAAGVERLKGILRTDLTYDRTWVLLNKVLPEFAKSFNDFLEVAKYLAPIAWDADVVRSYARRTVAFSLDSNVAFSLAIVDLAKKVFGEEVEDAIESLVAAKSRSLRQPIESQIEDLENDLEAIYHERHSLEMREYEARKRWRFIWRFVPAFLVSLALGASMILWGSGLAPRLTIESVAVAITGISLVIASLGTISTDKPRDAAYRYRMRRLQVRETDVERSIENLSLLLSSDPETLLKQGRRAEFSIMRSDDTDLPLEDED